MAGLLLSNLIMRKIDMMWLNYDHSATTSSGINEDFFPVKYLGRMDDCGLFQRFKPLGDPRLPAPTRRLWLTFHIPIVHVVELGGQDDHVGGALAILDALQLWNGPRSERLIGEQLRRRRNYTGHQAADGGNLVGFVRGILGDQNIPLGWLKLTMQKRIEAAVVIELVTH